MWIFTPFGFFSIVAHRDNSAAVCVRGRNRADLEAFGLCLLVANEDVGRPKAIKHTPKADYPFRIIAHRTQVARLLASFVEEDLDYDNFKGRVAEHDPERAHLYLEVWMSMRKIDPGARPKIPYVGEIGDDLG